MLRRQRLPLTLEHTQLAFEECEAEDFQDWVHIQVTRVGEGPKPLLPVVQELKDLIEGDTNIYMLFNQMLEQVPHKLPCNMDSSKRYFRVNLFSFSSKTSVKQHF